MNDAADPVKPTGEKERFPWKRVALVLLLLALLALLLAHCRASSLDAARQAALDARLDSLRRADSLARLDSLRLVAQRDSLLRRRQAIEDSLRRLDSLALLDMDAARRRRFVDSLARLRRQAADSLRRLDSLRADSLERARRANRDTLPPYIFADPAAGLHTAPIDVAVLTEEASATPLCGPDTLHFRPCRDMIRVADRLVLWISGRDTAGNRTRPERLEYVVDPNASRCGARRALVPLPGGAEFCVDVYEYPNDPALLPRTSVSWDEAAGLCAKAGKRLCSLEELTAACRGEHGWAYPYGDRYLPGRCQDVEGTVGRGVAKPACRSWWGAFHLVGNAWEWSSTPVGRTYFAVGGTYTGGPEDKCGRTTRSFFSQNRYEPVGFRCCEAAPP